MSGSMPVKSSDGGAPQVKWIARMLGSGCPLKLVGGGSNPAINNTLLWTIVYSEVGWDQEKIKQDECWIPIVNALCEWHPSVYIVPATKGAV